MNDVKTILGEKGHLIPTMRTLKVIKSRRDYLLEKARNNTSGNQHVINELRAMEILINFITWMSKNSSLPAVQTIKRKYREDTGTEPAALTRTVSQVRSAAGAL